MLLSLSQAQEPGRRVLAGHPAVGGGGGEGHVGSEGGGGEDFHGSGGAEGCLAGYTRLKDASPGNSGGYSCWVPSPLTLAPSHPCLLAPLPPRPLGPLPSLPLFSFLLRGTRPPPCPLHPSPPRPLSSFPRRLPISAAAYTINPTYVSPTPAGSALGDTASDAGPVWRKGKWSSLARSRAVYSRARVPSSRPCFAYLCPGA